MLWAAPESDADDSQQREHQAGHQRAPAWRPDAVAGLGDADLGQYGDADDGDGQREAGEPAQPGGGLGRGLGGGKPPERDEDVGVEVVVRPERLHEEWEAEA